MPRSGQGNFPSYQEKGSSVVETPTHPRSAEHHHAPPGTIIPNTQPHDPSQLPPRTDTGLMFNRPRRRHTFTLETPVENPSSAPVISTHGRGVRPNPPPRSNPNSLARQCYSDMDVDRPQDAKKRKRDESLKDPKRPKHTFFKD